MNSRWKLFSSVFLCILVHSNSETVVDQSCPENATDCIIDCSNCDDQEIHCPTTASCDTCVINCASNAACYFTEIYSHSCQDVAINCNAQDAIRYGTIYAPDSFGNLTLNAVDGDNCFERATVVANQQNTGFVQMNCNDDAHSDTCKELIVNATSASNVQIQCQGDSNCAEAQIYCPDGEHAMNGPWGTSCLVNCSDTTNNACEAVSVFSNTGLDADVTWLCANNLDACVDSKLYCSSGYSTHCDWSFVESSDTWSCSGSCGDSPTIAPMRPETSANIIANDGDATSPDSSDSNDSSESSSDSSDELDTFLYLIIAVLTILVTTLCAAFTFYVYHVSRQSQSQMSAMQQQLNRLEELSRSASMERNIIGLRAAKRSVTGDSRDSRDSRDSGISTQSAHSAHSANSAQSGGKDSTDSSAYRGTNGNVGDIEIVGDDAGGAQISGTSGINGINGTDGRNGKAVTNIFDVKNRGRRLNSLSNSKESIDGNDGNEMPREPPHPEATDSERESEMMTQSSALQDDLEMGGGVDRNGPNEEKAESKNEMNEELEQNANGEEKDKMDVPDKEKNEEAGKLEKKGSFHAVTASLVDGLNGLLLMVDDQSRAQADEIYNKGQDLASKLTRYTRKGGVQKKT